MKLLTVVGARPQFVKVAPVSRALQKRADVEDVLVHTGQHFDAGMSDVFFRELGISAPGHHLGVAGGGHGVMTGAMLQALEPLIEHEMPDVVLVYGDTNSTLAGALAAAKLHIPVAHVEAGLRSYNRRMPEEQNRVLTDHLSEYLFTPTDAATANLAREGVAPNRVHQVGDVMFDAALMFGARAREHSDVLERHGLLPGEYVLATIHRAENTDIPRRLLTILEGLDAVASDLPVVLPLHPRTRKTMQVLGLTLRSVQVIEPVGYLDMVALECQAAAIATDSGGVQKEAYFHGVPCVTLRDETEWVELIELGWNQLAPPENTDIASTILNAVGKVGCSGRPYGDGDAAEKVAAAIGRHEPI